MEFFKKNRDKEAVWLIIIMMVFQVSLHKVLAGIIPAFNVSYNPPWLCALYMLIMVAVYVLVLTPRIWNYTKSKGEWSADSKSEARAEGKNKWCAGGKDECSADGNGAMEDSACFGLPEAIRRIIVKYKYLCIALAILLLAIISVDIVTIVRGQLRISNILTHNLDYFYAFLALPLAILLVDGSWKIESMVKIMIILTVLSGLMRFGVSLYYGFSGNEILCISRESSIEGWIRNDRLRMVAPCFTVLLMPICVYFAVKSKSLTDRLIYGVGFLFNLFYIYYVWQSRACLIYTIFAVGVIVMFWPASRKITRIKWCAALGAVILFLICGGMRIILDQFSTSETSKYFMENKGHYNVYKCFWAKYAASPIFGDGLTETLAEWFPNGRALWLSDGGFLYSIVPMGCLMIVFFVFVLVRAVLIYVKNVRISDKAVLAFGMTAMVYACGVSIDCFMTGIAFSVPFYLAIVEYVAKSEDCHG